MIEVILQSYRKFKPPPPTPGSKHPDCELSRDVVNFHVMSNDLGPSNLSRDREALHKSVYNFLVIGKIA